MKKIIAFLFFVGVLTAAFAQDDRHDRYGSQSNESRYQQSPNYSTDNYGNNEQYQQNNRQYENGYGYNDNREFRDREYLNREPRDFRDGEDNRRSENYYPGCDNYQRMENHSYRNNRRRAWFELVWNSRERH